MGIKMPGFGCGVCSILCRRKSVDVRHVYDTQLKRCLNIVNLIALGKQCFICISFHFQLLKGFCTFQG